MRWNSQEEFLGKGETGAESGRKSSLERRGLGREKERGSSMECTVDNTLHVQGL